MSFLVLDTSPTEETGMTIDSGLSWDRPRDGRKNRKSVISKNLIGIKLTLELKTLQDLGRINCPSSLRSSREEQEMLKQVHLLKNELRDNGWSEGKPPSITQPSFLRTDIGLDEPSHRFD